MTSEGNSDVKRAVMDIDAQSFAVEVIQHVQGADATIVSQLIRRFSSSSQ